MSDPDVLADHRKMREVSIQKAALDGVVEGAVRPVVRELEMLRHVFERIAGRVRADDIG